MVSQTHMPQPQGTAVGGTPSSLSEASTTDFTALSRLQLQSFCVRAGLDATGETPLLIQRLQDHHGQPRIPPTATTTITPGTVPNTKLTMTTASAESEQKQQLQEESIVKEEHDVKVEQPEDAVEIKTEADSAASTVTTGLAQVSLVNQEFKDPFMRDADLSTSGSESFMAKLKSELDDDAESKDLKQPKEEEIITVKKEEDASGERRTSLRVKNLSALWESKAAAATAAASSTIAAAANHNRQRTLSATASPRKPVAGFKRTRDEPTQHESQSANNGGFLSRAMGPTQASIAAANATRLKKNATTAPTTPSIPSKKQKMTIAEPTTPSTSASSSSTATVSPSATTAAVSTTSRVAGGKVVKKSQAVNTTGKKILKIPAVAQATIDRLATPKNKVTTTAATTTTAPQTGKSPSPATPAAITTATSAATRARGPTLSTAARAAQRSHRKD